MQSQTQRQLDDIYEEEGSAFRKFAVALLVVGLAALFVYRFASTDPSWEVQPNGTISK